MGRLFLPSFLDVKVGAFYSSTRRDFKSVQCDCFTPLIRVASEDNYGEGKLERTREDIEELLSVASWVGILTLRICLSELDSSLNILST